MPKLKVVPAKKIVSWLEKKGFKVLRQKGSHILLQKESLITIVPLHKSDLPRGTIRKILRDTEISLETYKKEM